MIWAATAAGRGVRASVVAVLAVVLAVSAHTAACGELPSLSVTGCGAALAVRVCWGCAGRRMSLPRIAGLVTGVQTSLHLAFAVAALSRHAPGSPAGSAAVPLDVSHGAGGADLLPGGPAMVLAHVGAALVLAWWLSVGERLLWRVARGAAAVARGAAGRLRRRKRPPFACPAATHAVPRHRPPTCRAPQLGQLVHLVIRRGPPSPAPA